jgi:antitoxin ParD1/3/4
MVAGIGDIIEIDLSGEYPSMSSAIAPEIVAKVQSFVQSGAYANESEVLGEALQLLERRDQLRALVKVGLDELDRGERLNGEEVFRELEAEAAEIGWNVA